MYVFSIQSVMGAENACSGLALDACIFHINVCIFHIIGDGLEDSWGVLGWLGLSWGLDVCIFHTIRDGC